MFFMDIWWRWFRRFLNCFLVCFRCRLLFCCWVMVRVFVWFLLVMCGLVVIVCCDWFCNLLMMICVKGWVCVCYVVVKVFWCCFGRLVRMCFIWCWWWCVVVVWGYCWCGWCCWSSLFRGLCCRIGNILWNCWWIRWWIVVNFMSSMIVCVSWGCCRRWLVVVGGVIGWSRNFLNWCWFCMIVWGWLVSIVGCCWNICRVCCNWWMLMNLVCVCVLVCVVVRCWFRIFVCVSWIVVVSVVGCVSRVDCWGVVVCWGCLVCCLILVKVGVRRNGYRWFMCGCVVWLIVCWWWFMFSGLSRGIWCWSFIVKVWVICLVLICRDRVGRCLLNGCIWMIWRFFLFVVVSCFVRVGWRFVIVLLMVRVIGIGFMMKLSCCVMFRVCLVRWWVCGWMWLSSIWWYSVLLRVRNVIGFWWRICWCWFVVILLIWCWFMWIGFLLIVLWLVWSVWLVVGLMSGWWWKMLVFCVCVCWVCCGRVLVRCWSCVLICWGNVFFGWCGLSGCCLMFVVNCVRYRWWGVIICWCVGFSSNWCKVLRWLVWGRWLVVLFMRWSSCCMCCVWFFLICVSGWIVLVLMVIIWVRNWSVWMFRFCVLIVWLVILVCLVVSWCWRCCCLIFMLFLKVFWVCLVRGCVSMLSRWSVWCWCSGWWCEGRWISWNRWLLICLLMFVMFCLVILVWLVGVFVWSRWFVVNWVGLNCMCMIMVVGLNCFCWSGYLNFFLLLRWRVRVLVWVFWLVMIWCVIWVVVWWWLIRGRVCCLWFVCCWWCCLLRWVDDVGGSVVKKMFVDK